MVAAGAALLPDLDHHNGTIAGAFGPISKALCRIVAAVSGGHRHATHSLIGAAVFTAAAWAATRNVWALGVVVWLCIGLAVRALWKRPKNRPNGRFDYRDVAGLIHAVAAAVLAALLVSSIDAAGVVPWAVGIGYLTHLAGDAMTEKGIPLVWPSMRRYRVATIDTGKSVERVIRVSLLVTLGAIVYGTHGLWAPALIHSIR